MPLREQIEDEIRERGPIPFSRYMELCLYDPAHGYYAANASQFGKAGDFYTSSDIHAVFGRLVARQFEEMWQALDRPPHIEILELGPGRGLFARDVLDWSKKKFPDFFSAVTYTLQESSPALRTRLQHTLDEHINAGKASVSKAGGKSAAAKARVPDLEEYVVAAKVSVRDVGRNDAAAKASVPEERPKIAQRFSAGKSVQHDQVPEGRLPSLSRTLADAPLILFANEFFDALPVEILSSQGKLHLALAGNHLQETWLPPRAEELDFFDRYGVPPEPGERIEVPMIAQNWIQLIAQSINRGFLVLIDYGYTRREQLAGRHRGTLMAYRQHSVSPDPYQAPGEQDLTAHVNFTALTAVCEQVGMQVEKLLTQSQFLLGIGEKNQFADAFEDCRLPQERAKVALQLKHLITPEGMGENFQALMASRGVDPNKLAALSGLSFGTGSRF